MNVTDKPLADKGLTSYRYHGHYGYIMIGAKDTADALREAQRSSSYEVHRWNLQVWNGKFYEDCFPNG